MNEIKFRIWSKSLGGFIVEDITPTSLAIGCVMDSSLREQIANEEDLIIQQKYKDVYEGDIISCEEHQMLGMENRKHPIAVVISRNGNVWYSLDTHHGYYNPHQYLSHAQKVKVIGNILQNPDLLPASAIKKVFERYASLFQKLADNPIERDA